MVERKGMDVGKEMEMGDEFVDPKFLRFGMGRLEVFDFVWVHISIDGLLVAAVDEERSHAGGECTMGAFKQANEVTVVPNIEPNSAIEKMDTGARNPGSGNERTVTKCLLFAVEVVYNRLDKFQGKLWDFSGF